MDMAPPNRVKQKQRPLQRPDSRSRDSSRQKPQAFAQVMSQTQMQRMPQVQRQIGEQAGREQEREKPREKKAARRARPRERGEARTQHGGEARSKGERTAEGPKHRVVVKIGGEREGGGEGGGKGGQFSGGGGRGESGPRSKSAENIKQYAQAKTDLSFATASKFQQAMAAQQKAPAQLNTKQMQQLVNLLVQAIRIGKDEVGNDELQVAFQAAVFKGLRLRLQAKDGKVSVTFMSDDPGVRALFRKERDRISKQLKAKGREKGFEVGAIEVGGIEVVT